MSGLDGLKSQRARRAWYRNYVWVAGVAVGLVVIGLGVGYWRRTQLEARIERELARIRGAGEPVTAADVVAMYPRVEPEVDHTRAWERAFEALAGLYTDPESDGLPFVGFGPEPTAVGEAWKQLGEAEAFLQKYGEGLELLHAAAEAGTAVRFAPQILQGEYVQWPYYSERREALRLLELEFAVGVQQGDSSAAVASIQAMFALGRITEPEPSQTSFLMRLAYDAVARAQIESLLGSAHVSEDELLGLEQVLRRIDYRRGLYRAALAERVSDQVIFRQPKQIDAIRQVFEQMEPMIGPDLEKLGRPFPRGPTRIDAFIWKRWRWGDWLESLELARERVAAARQPWPQGLRDAEAVARRAEGLRPPLRIMSRMNHRNGHGAFHSALRNTALNRACDAAIAVELYRRRHESLPERLEQLVPDWLPEVPVDPFAAKPLRYVVRDGGYVVYSVGADGQDDGGTEDRKTGAPDVVFGVSRRGRGDE